MPHFASGLFPATFGVVASLSTAAAALTRPASTATGSTEGTNQLTYVVPVTGWYRVSSSDRLVVASDAGTSHTLATFVTYNNGSAQAIATLAMTGVTPGVIDAKGAVVGFTLQQEAMIYAVAATTILVQSREVVVGTTATVGSADLRWVISGVA